MKTDLQPNHCELQNNPAWPARPFPGEDVADPLQLPAQDWETLLEKYRKGDKLTLTLLCDKAKPLLERISRERYYVAHLGREESYSIAAMSMVNFWHSEAELGEWDDIPRRLTQAMKCDLLNQIRRNKTRRSREIHCETDRETEEDRLDLPVTNNIDPEQQALQEEWNRKVRECLKYLGDKERQVIYNCFFLQLSVPEIARRMHCTTACVSSTKRNALYKLRKIFEEELTGSYQPVWLPNATKTYRNED